MKPMIMKFPNSCSLVILLSTIAVLLVTASENLENETQATLYYQDGKPVVKMGIMDEAGGIAIATFNDSLEDTGWSVLNIKAGFGRKMTDQEVMFAAGYLEGVLTSKRIYQWVVNMQGYFFKDKSKKLMSKTRRFFAKQDSWMRHMIRKNSKDPYWQIMSLVLAQFDGLLSGYKAMPYQNKTVDIFDLQSLNGAGDLLDILSALDKSQIPNWLTMTKEQFSTYMSRNGRCSALVKVLPGYEDIFMGHSTWLIYAATVRVFKHYNFNLATPYMTANKMSFSSYPGTLASADDFYILNSGLVMLQTTNNIFNTSLYKMVNPQSLLSWQRVRIAHHLTTNGKEWADVFAKFNSGTYNNQYMIIDKKKINEEIQAGALWIVEQIPGLVERGDQTPILRAGYWASYNIPFYETIYNMSGYPSMKTRLGNYVSYQLCPRAEIFRRDQGQVSDMESFKHILRYNDYLTDPYSNGDPCNTVCCRGDLKSTATASGCTDTKVTNLGMSAKMASYAINGPTRGDNLPVFEWTEEFTDSHIGAPQRYDYDFEFMEPANWQR